VTDVTRVDATLRITTDPDSAPAINHELVNAGIAVSEMAPDRATLEEVFLELTHHGKGEA
jgi:hypothetical protein